MPMHTRCGGDILRCLHHQCIFFYTGYKNVIHKVAADLMGVHELVRGVGCRCCCSSDSCCLRLIFNF